MLRLIRCQDGKIRKSSTSVYSIDVVSRVGVLQSRVALLKFDNGGLTRGASFLVMVGVASAVPVFVPFSALVNTGTITC